MNLFVQHVSLLAFCHFEEVSNKVVRSFDTVLFQPPDDVGAARHVADTNDLLQSKVASRNTRIDASANQSSPFRMALMTAEA